MIINGLKIQGTVSFGKTKLDIFNSDRYLIASLDVNVLFTNIPLAETIPTISDILYNNSTHIHDINKLQFEKLLEIITKDNVFTSCISYKQVDGVAMASP